MGAANVTLYARWTPVASGYSVTYNANGATGGTVPADPSTYYQSSSVTVLGNSGSLVYSGFKFVGWQTMADGSGTTYAPGGTFLMGTANITLYALWANGYAYVVNQNGGSAGTISQYTIGPNGALTPMLTRTVATGGVNSQRIAADPAGKYVYVSNVSGNSVSQFTIGADGVLAPMSTPTFLVGPGPGIYYPWSIAVHPTGNWAYVSINQRQATYQYTVGANGALSPMTPPSVLGGYSPDTIVVDPSGKYAYVANGRGNDVSQYTISQTTGALSPMTPATVAAGGTSGSENAWFVAVEPKGKYAYVTNYFDGTVSQYAINQTNGTLSAMTPATVVTSALYASSIAIDPLGKYAYVANPAGTGSDSVRQFNISQTDGTLSPMTPLSVSAGGTGAGDITIDPTGKFAYATVTNSVAQYAIGANGALTLMAHPTVQAGIDPNGITTVKIH
jgi:6-phosphogluconolactonase (cycloisomerase 2 family)